MVVAREVHSKATTNGERSSGESFTGVLVDRPSKLAKLSNVSGARQGVNRRRKAVSPLDIRHGGPQIKYPNAASPYSCARRP